MALSLPIHVPLSIPRVSKWCARALLALLPLGLAAPVSAATIYTFSFGSAASGHFITDGASADPGFELITSMTIDFVQTRDDLSVHAGPFTTTDFEPGAAYNPVTGAFINHYVGNTYDDIGSLFLRRPGFSSVSILGMSFSEYGSLDGWLHGRNSETLAYGGLFVRPGVPADAPVVPEPATLVLLGSGLLCAGFARKRRAQ